MILSFGVLLLIITTSLCWSGLDTVRKVLARRIEPIPLVALLTLAQIPIFSLWVISAGAYGVQAGYLVPGLTAVLINIAATPKTSFQVGDEVSVTGDHQEFYCNTQVRASAMQKVGGPSALPDPVALAKNSSAEDLETWRRELAGLPWPTGNLPEVMRSGTATLQALVREYLFVSLFRACAESLASENASRLAAMQRADKNIDELLADLNGAFHRLRQSGIDEELFDVISGFEALRNERRRRQAASSLAKGTKAQA